MTIGQVLKDKRKEFQFTQEQLAEKIYVTNRTISNWETGKTTPDIDSLIRLANLFDLSLDNLLLEGSEVVENIKKYAEVKRIKNYQRATIITNFVFLFAFLTQDLFGTISMPVLIAMLIGGISNILAMTYFSTKIDNLLKRKNDNKKIWIVVIIIILLAIISVLISKRLF